MGTVAAAQVLSAKVKLMSLQESLLELEMDTVEVLATLVTEFDRAYSEMAEANKLQYNAYFSKVCWGLAVGVRGEPRGRARPCNEHKPHCSALLDHTAELGEALERQQTLATLDYAQLRTHGLERCSNSNNVVHAFGAKTCAKRVLFALQAGFRFTAQHFALCAACRSVRSRTTSSSH
jgi:hypothetical protein